MLALTLAIGIALLLSPAFRHRAGDLATPGAGSVDSGAGRQRQRSGRVPAGWVTPLRQRLDRRRARRRTQPGSFNGFPQYKDRATGRTLRVSTTARRAAASPTPWPTAGRRLRRSPPKHQNYREIAIAKADYRGLEAADWEFTYDDGGASLHALDRVFVVDGTGYSLFFQTHGTDDWDAAKADFDKIAAAFKP